jgi:hypothetical protein
MSERERQINRGLHALDDAHRLGRIARDEYRLRRRHLLASLLDDTYETVRDTVRRAAPAHATARPTLPPISKRSAPPEHDWKARSGDRVATRTPLPAGGSASGSRSGSSSGSSSGSRSRSSFGWRQLALSVCVLGALGVGVGLLFWLMLRT